VLAAAEGQVIEVLPALAGEQPVPRERHQPAPVGQEGPRRPVLMQVPDAQLARLLTEALQLEGLPEPALLRSGIELRGASTEEYSFALIQHDPPAVDGLRLLERLRAAQSGPEVQLPVVLLTGDREQAVIHTNVTADWLFTPCSLSYARTKLRYLTLRLACRWVRARLPDNEAGRLADLRRLAILDTPPEERFDRITRIAAASMGVPIALISLVDQDRQWFKSCIGLDVRETPRDVAFCAHAVEQGADVVVPDTLLDERFADNPLVTDGPRIRFYAGAPLLTGNGSCLGTLCVVDTRPRELSAAELATLHDLRDMAVDQLGRPARSGAAPATTKVE
jgi:DNA-binding response OmpR family regulator